MGSYQIISDGSCDLGRERSDRIGVKIIPYYVSFDGEKFYKEIEEMDVRRFYTHMAEHPKVFPKTSLPPVQDYVDAFTSAARQGRDILCLCLSGKFSGSFNSARNAAQIVRKLFQNVRIAVVDTTLATALQGLLVQECARMRDAGLDLDSVLGKVIGLAASTLGIKPLISMKNGEIYPEGMTRSRKKAFVRIMDMARNFFKESGENADHYAFASGYGYDYKECVEFTDHLVASMQSYCHINAMEIYQIGATIGVHTGPYPLGMGFLKRYEYV